MSKKIVIAGSGFAGLWSALAAARAIELAGKEGEVEVIVISPSPTMVVRPRLYEAVLDEVAPDCKTLGEFEPKGHRRPSTLTALSEKLAIDANDFTRKQLTPEMLSQYDLVVNIADRNQTPDWLRGDNVIWWKVLYLGPEFTRERLWQNYDILADKVKKLIDLEKTSNNYHELDDNIDEEQN